MTIANRISAPTSAPMAYHCKDSMIFMRMPSNAMIETLARLLL